MKNKILALVLARKNSIRLKNKNILKLGQKPLIGWTLSDISSLKKNFDGILISSDSIKILKIGKSYKFITVKRPKKFAKKNSSSESTALHALKFYTQKFKKKISHIFLFQPTSPFRSKKNILKAIELSNKFKQKRIISCKRLRNKLIINGNIYICPTKILKNKGSFESKTFIPLIINSKKQNIDIDNIDDFNTAKTYVK